MILPEYHTHTYYCDGAEAPEVYIKEAIKQGLPAYGFSSHSPVPFESDWNVPDEKLNNYLNDVKAIKEKYGSQIEVYLGLEVDYIAGVAGRNRHVLKDIALDYFIGSIHYVDQFKDGRPWNIDTSLELYKEGLAKIYGNDIQKAVTAFYEASRQMIEEDKPDVIGHFDKIKMFNTQVAFFNENESWYKDQIDLLLKTLKVHNTIVEINTRGYYKYGQLDLYPSEWIIEKMVKMDIPIMINSDAHHPSEFNKGTDYAIGKIKNLGITKVYILKGHKWQSVEI